MATPERYAAISVAPRRGRTWNRYASASKSTLPTTSIPAEMLLFEPALTLLSVSLLSDDDSVRSSVRKSYRVKNCVVERFYHDNLRIITATQYIGVCAVRSECECRRLKGELNTTTDDGAVGFGGISHG